MTRLEALEAVARAARELLFSHLNCQDTKTMVFALHRSIKNVDTALAALDAVPVEGPCLACDGRGVTNRHIPFPDPCPYCNGTGRTK